MRRAFLVIGLTLTAMLGATQAQAGWHDFWHRFHLTYHRQKAWPQPFQSADQHLTRQHFAIMVDNGWRANNTLTDQLFDGTTQELNNAGAMKVRWIMTQAPEHRRTVFVLRGPNEQVTRVRLESVERVVSGFSDSQGQSSHLVMLTDREPVNISGHQVDTIERLFRESVPSPVLPPQATGGQ